MSTRLAALAGLSLTLSCAGGEGSPTLAPSPTEAASLHLPCALQDADLSGLPGDLDVFDPARPAGSLLFYIAVDLSQMDLTPDDPEPSADVPAVASTPAEVTVVDALTCRGQVFTKTEVRYKGNTTFDKPKPQFKVKFDKDEALGAYRTVNLHSGWKDATLFREKLAYDLCNEAGLVAPRANHALVFVEDTSAGDGYAYDGLYTLVEQVNARFLSRRYGEANKDGDLYKTYYGWKGSRRGFATLQVEGDGDPEDYRGGNGWADTYDGDARAYRLKTNEDEGMEDYSDLAAFVRALDEGDAASALDVASFTRWLAVNTLLGGWDNYWLNAQNYYLYHGEDEIWRWIPWDHDNVLGNNFQDHNGFHIESEDILYPHYPQNALTTWLLSDASRRSDYLDDLDELLAGPFQAERFEARLATLREQVGDAARFDPLKQYSNDEWLGNQDDLIITHSDEDGEFGNKAHHLGILAYVAARSASVKSQVAAARADLLKAVPNPPDTPGCCAISR